MRNHLLAARRTFLCAVDANVVVRFLSVRDTVEGVVRNVLQPLVEADGGTLELVDVRGELVIVRLGGAYRGCPSAPYTLQGVIAPAFKRALGDKVKIELVV